MTNNLENSSMAWYGEVDFCFYNMTAILATLLARILSVSPKF